MCATKWVVNTQIQDCSRWMSKSRNRLVTNNKYKEEENTYYHKPQNNFNISVLPRCCWRLDLDACVVAFNRNQDITWFTCTNLLISVFRLAEQLQGVFFSSLNAFKCLFYFQNVYKHNTKSQQNNINKNKKGIWDLKNKIFSNLAYLICPRFHLSRTTGFNLTKLSKKHQW